MRSGADTPSLVKTVLVHVARIFGESILILIGDPKGLGRRGGWGCAMKPFSGLSVLTLMISIAVRDSHQTRDRANHQTGWSSVKSGGIRSK